MGKHCFWIWNLGNVEHLVAFYITIKDGREALHLVIHSTLYIHKKVSVIIRTKDKFDISGIPFLASAQLPKRFRKEIDNQD